jgi:nickel transport protein
MLGRVIVNLKQVIFPLIFAFFLVTPVKTLAHGTKIEYRQIQGIQIQAKYDDGKPMKSAQVVIYAPNNPGESWLTGVTDDQGYFQFIPDPSQPGNWDIKVRQAGHGEILTIALDQDQVISLTQTNNDLIQKIVLAGMGIWGMIGTALFFKQRNEKNARS